MAKKNTTTQTCTVTDLITSKVPDINIKLAIIKTTMSTNIIRLGGKRVIEIAPEMLELPKEYQRKSNVSRAMKIAREWDYHKYKNPVVAYRNGHLYLIDGGHTALAAVYAGVPAIMVEVVEDIDIFEEAKLFDTQDDNKVRVNWYNKYKSMLFRQHPAAVALHDICEKYRLVIGPTSDQSVRRMSAVSRALKLIAKDQFGPDFIDWCFSVMDQSNHWLVSGTDGATDCHINMLTDVYLEGMQNGLLDLYTERLIAVMDKYAPAQFDAMANTEYDKVDKRTPTKRLCLAIAHGDYVAPAKGRIVRPDTD